ncbi:hypothetical protein R6Q59_015710 [Mikania micrantha]|uniref:Uncharacterized protein n=1 Tax=Mikania micrantha TaxID=192012 RepID=A0A5N6PHT8_9ASTR|nr:hypothetical protein E3N88_08654 [Mikania micrantha]
MASACLNRIGISPENLLECSQKYSSYSWFSHRLSIGREMQEEDVSKSKTKRISSPAKNLSDPSEVSDPAKELSDLQEEQDLKEFDGFEFILDNPVSMLPADELFSDGKLVPMRLSVIHQEAATSTTPGVSGVRSPDTPRITDESFATVDNNNQYLFSPRAPRCSSRWKELLGFRKLHQSSNNVAKVDINKRTSISSSSNTGTGATRSIRQFLNRSSKYPNDSSINLPLLKDADTESVSVSSRPSLSSSSSGHDLDDLPRLSLDSDKLKLNLNMNPNNPPKTRMLKTRTHQTEARTTTRVGRNTMRRSSESTASAGNRGLSVDSPRMNSSGKIIFHSLERSSSSPSSFNGGPRFKYRGMERSYSANVRVTPVLNVPVCSLRGSSKSGGVFGFPIFSSQQKREGCSTGSNIGVSNRSLRFNGNR